MQSVLDPLALRLDRRSAVTGSIRWVIAVFTFAPVREAKALAQEPFGVAALVLDRDVAPQSKVESGAEVPAVARRLLDELLCTCGEPDCARPPLAACRCDYAQKKRKQIIDEVRRLGFGSRERDDATYTAILRSYTAQHGADATLAAVRGSERLDRLLTLALFLAGLTLIASAAERYRRSRADRHPRGQPTHPRKRKSGRRRRSWSSH